MQTPSQHSRFVPSSAFKGSPDPAQATNPIQSGTYALDQYYILYSQIGSDPSQSYPEIVVVNRDLDNSTNNSKFSLEETLYLGYQPGSGSPPGPPQLIITRSIPDASNDTIITQDFLAVGRNIQDANGTYLVQENFSSLMIGWNPGQPSILVQSGGMGVVILIDTDPNGFKYLSYSLNETQQVEEQDMQLRWLGLTYGVLSVDLSFAGGDVDPVSAFRKKLKVDASHAITGNNHHFALRYEAFYEPV